MRVYPVPQPDHSEAAVDNVGGATGQSLFSR